ncbi:hypothetical protein SKAU_G00286450 [Synaphobranchus kaupii]|uniref:Uncharacterized protein n=1 Tax=Synaphobranchus kaupii TaxID=118154 RepID=A0A9Q1INI4_SYNKA|nr:hypothetical protein SKAU_G00286450 [Synaphobranchus kaupii]
MNYVHEDTPKELWLDQQFFKKTQIRMHPLAFYAVLGSLSFRKGLHRTLLLFLCHSLLFLFKTSIQKKKSVIQHVSEGDRCHQNDTLIFCVAFICACFCVCWRVCVLRMRPCVCLCLFVTVKTTCPPPPPTHLVVHKFQNVVFKTVSLLLRVLEEAFVCRTPKHSETWGEEIVVLAVLC